jgi:hypothetical protein
MADIQNISGTLSGYQNLGGTSYHIGNDSEVVSSYRYTQSDLLTGLGQTTDNIQTGDYSFYDATQDIQSATGTDVGQQNLNRVTYAIYGTTYIEIKEVEPDPILIKDITGLYQDRFEGYIA